jgi:hypothetical protein
MDLLTYDLYYYRILKQLEILKKNKLEILRQKSLKLIRALPILYSAPTEQGKIYFLNN